MMAPFGGSEAHLGQWSSWEGTADVSTILWASPLKSTCISSSCLRERCAENASSFLIGFSLGWGTCAIKESHVCHIFPGCSDSFGEALGGGERYRTFHFSFGCLISVKFTYSSVLFPSPHLRSFSLFFFLKTSGIPIFSLFRGNQFCKSE